MKAGEATLGAKIGRLTIESLLTVKVAGRNRKFAKVICDCGIKKQVRLDQLGTDVFSCGCLNSEMTAAKGRANKTHGMSKTNTYKCWCGMWERTTNKDHPKYPLYKDRVPPADWKSFEVFYAYMGDCPTGYTLERSDNMKPYGPGNCEWVSKSAQGSNTSRIRWVMFNGEAMPLTRAVELAGLTWGNFSYRYYTKKLSLSECLGGPVVELAGKPQTISLQDGSG